MSYGIGESLGIAFGGAAILALIVYAASATLKVWSTPAAAAGGAHHRLLPGRGVPLL